MAYSSLSLSKTAPHVPHLTNPISSSFYHFHSPSLFLSFPFYPRLSPLRAAATSDGDHFLRKPLVPQPNTSYGYDRGDDDDDEEEEEEEEDKCVDWEDQILEDTVPLVGFVRMLLHSGQYESGDRLSPEHEKTILEKLLPFHPEYEKKIGVGVDYITIGYHPNFERSRCLFIARKDGELVDFSYWKCIKGLIRKNYPLYADSFILRHFRKRSSHQLRS
ncbi:protein DCL, chloroplastic [Arachis hypogaea]|uniref:protein DCL, chloroplastic n=1 Tax=Arachis hypogaea TaxID=3818 RepID=UPI000DED38E6|nr:protein DCL homolog, chloroplastic [Arachis hypogaea]